MVEALDDVKELNDLRLDEKIRLKEKVNTSENTDDDVMASEDGARFVEIMNAVLSEGHHDRGVILEGVESVTAAEQDELVEVAIRHPLDRRMTRGRWFPFLNGVTLKNKRVIKH